MPSLRLRKETTEQNEANKHVLCAPGRMGGRLALGLWTRNVMRVLAVMYRYEIHKTEQDFL